MQPVCFKSHIIIPPKTLKNNWLISFNRSICMRFSLMQTVSLFVCLLVSIIFSLSQTISVYFVVIKILPSNNHRWYWWESETKQMETCSRDNKLEIKEILKWNRPKVMAGEQLLSFFFSVHFYFPELFASFICFCLLVFFVSGLFFCYSLNPIMYQIKWDCLWKANEKWCGCLKATTM